LISWRGLCSTCGPRRSEENITGLKLMQGEPLQRWRRGMAASVGGIILPPELASALQEFLASAEQASDDTAA
jgi:hypothetical protein